MKELSVVIQVTPIGTMAKEKYEFMAADYFSFNPKTNESSAGISYNCNQEIYIDTPSVSDMRDFSIPRSVIVTFRDSSDRNYRIGTTEIPATVHISPLLNSALLTLKCTMLASPLV